MRLYALCAGCLVLSCILIGYHEVTCITNKEFFDHVKGYAEDLQSFDADDPVIKDDDDDDVIELPGDGHDDLDIPYLITKLDLSDALQDLKNLNPEDVVEDNDNTPGDPEDQDGDSDYDASDDVDDDNDDEREYGDKDGLDDDEDSGDGDHDDDDDVFDKYEDTNSDPSGDISHDSGVINGESGRKEDSVNEIDNLINELNELHIAEDELLREDMRVDNNGNNVKRVEGNQSSEFLESDFPTGPDEDDEFYDDSDDNDDDDDEYGDEPSDIDDNYEDDSGLDDSLEVEPMGHLREYQIKHRSTTNVGWFRHISRIIRIVRHVKRVHRVIRRYRPRRYRPRRYRPRYYRKRRYRTRRYRTRRYRQRRYRTRRYRQRHYRTRRYRQRHYRTRRYHQRHYRTRRYRQRYYHTRRYRQRHYRTRPYRQRHYRTRRYRQRHYHTRRYHQRHYHTRRYRQRHYHTRRYRQRHYHTKRYRQRHYRRQRYRTRRYQRNRTCPMRQQHRRYRQRYRYRHGRSRRYYRRSGRRYRRSLPRRLSMSDISPRPSSCHVRLDKTLRMNLKPTTWTFRLHACLNFAYLPDKDGIALTISNNERQLFNKEISLTSPPTLCFPVPYLKNIAHACVEAKRSDQDSDRMCLRMSTTIDLKVKKFRFGLDLLCGRMTKASTGQGRSDALDLLEDVQASVENKETGDFEDIPLYELPLLYRDLQQEIAKRKYIDPQDQEEVDKNEGLQEARSTHLQDIKGGKNQEENGLTGLQYLHDETETSQMADQLNEMDKENRESRVLEDSIAGHPDIRMIHEYAVEEDLDKAGDNAERRFGPTADAEDDHEVQPLDLDIENDG